MIKAARIMLNYSEQVLMERIMLSYLQGYYTEGFMLGFHYFRISFSVQSS